MAGREHGDRGGFTRRLRRRLEGGVAPNPAHPPPPPLATVPEIAYRVLDGEPSLVEVFARAAERVAARVHRVAGPDVPASVLDGVVAAHGVISAVLSPEPEAAQVGEVLRSLGVHVEPYDRSAGAGADLGVTSGRAAIAATGSVVLDSTSAAGRGASLLPRVHLCVVPVERLLATPGDLWRRHRPDPMPSGLVAVTGPSRTGDIEQILTLGVHGPTAVHVVLTGC